MKKLIEDRIKSAVRVTPSGCWEWTLKIDKHGYGRVKFNRKNSAAHRVSYQVFAGAIPDGFTIDHLCRNRACVNPSHLEPVTRKTNSLRGVGIPAINSRKTHCARGHPLRGDNLYTPPGRPQRICRACNCIRSRRYKERLSRKSENLQ